MRWYNIVILGFILAIISCGAKKELRTARIELDGDTETTTKEKSDARGSRADEITYLDSPVKMAESGLRAGYADDNKQYNYFLNFLSKYVSIAPHQDLDISERICFRLVDQAGKSLPNAEVSVYDNDKIIDIGKTYADGSFYFFPSMYNNNVEYYRVQYVCDGIANEQAVDRNGDRNYTLTPQLNRGEYTEAALDILFILDTTGSMGEEIDRLKATLEIIHLNLTSISPKVKVRFGLVLYKDKGDDYVTKVTPLTDDVDSFIADLNLVKADGGGDNPEDLQAALKEAIDNISWNPEAIRLAFIITDAPPHLDYGQSYTYIDAAMDAKERGIKLFSVGSGGLNIDGEYILRQISQLTSARYIFLTYGEKGESDGGVAGSVSHHTGDNYQTDKLESIILQFAREELSNIIDLPLEQDEEYFIAHKVENESSEQTLESLFTQALVQLDDYSCIKLDSAATLAIMPISIDSSSSESNRKYFTEQLLISARRHNRFALADRTELERIFEEWKLNLSGAISDSLTVKVGELTGAQLMLVGNMFDKQDQYELFLKLVRVETGELLSATKLKIDYRLGLI